MKTGAENRKQVMIMLGLMFVGLVVFVRMLVGVMGSPAAASLGDSSTVTSPARQSSRDSARRAAMSAALGNSLDPSLRLDLLRASENTKYSGSGRNIFKAEPEPPRIPKPVAAPMPLGPPKPPPPPPITLKFFGFASRPGEPKKVFLSQNEDVFIAGEGDIVDRRYKVLRIEPSQVIIQDVLNNNTQAIPLTQG